MCPLHRVQLRPLRVPISYGLVPVAPAGYLEEKQSLFPCAHTWVEGGCMPGTEKETGVISCPECERAEREWEVRRGVDLRR